MNALLNYKMSFVRHRNSILYVPATSRPSKRRQADGNHSFIVDSLYSNIEHLKNINGTTVLNKL